MGGGGVVAHAIYRHSMAHVPCTTRGSKGRPQEPTGTHVEGVSWLCSKRPATLAYVLVQLFELHTHRFYLSQALNSVNPTTHPTPRCGTGWAWCVCLWETSVTVWRLTRRPWSWLQTCTICPCAWRSSIGLYNHKFYLSPALNFVHPPPLTTPIPTPTPQVWNWLGLARVSMGDIRDGVEAYKKALELDHVLAQWVWPAHTQTFSLSPCLKP
jgi:hypothetical protein